MPSDKRKILADLATHFPGLREKFGVTKIGIFGSVARNQADVDSDIDIVVEMHPDLLKRACLKAELESILKRRVDVVRYRQDMNKLLKNRIDREGIYV